MRQLEIEVPSPFRLDLTVWACGAVPTISSTAGTVPGTAHPGGAATAGRGQRSTSTDHVRAHRGASRRRVSAGR